MTTSRLVSGTAFGPGATPLAGVIVRIYKRADGVLIGAATTSDGVTGVNTYATIAGEGGIFSVADGQTVRYGADTRRTQKTYAVGGTYACSTGEFGNDPAYGTVKTCERVDTIPPLGVGQYSIGCGYFEDEVQVVFLDPDGGTLYNDLIHRTYPAAD